MAKYIVGTIICDGTGTRAGLVDSDHPAEALMELGYTVIGHNRFRTEDSEEYDWKEYRLRHDEVTNAEDWFYHDPVEPKYYTRLFLDREETAFNRWMFLVKVGDEDLQNKSVMVVGHNEEGIPFVRLLTREEEVEYEDIPGEYSEWHRMKWEPGTGFKLICCKVNIKLL